MMDEKIKEMNEHKCQWRNECLILLNKLGQEHIKRSSNSKMWFDIIKLQREEIEELEDKYVEALEKAEKR